MSTDLWELSGSSDPRALAIVDGTGRWLGHGPHYSRRTPGSKTFTGVGQEIVLVRDDAVWAVVRNRLPSPVKPTENLTTEVRVAAAVKSEIPGYCYKRAGWVTTRKTRGLVIMRCPRAQILRAAGGAA